MDRGIRHNARRNAVREADRNGRLGEVGIPGEAART
jgi:hypothetical protein